MIFGISGVDNGGVGHNIKTLALIDLKILKYHRICAILVDFGAPGASFGFSGVENGAVGHKIKTLGYRNITKFV